MTNRNRLFGTDWKYFLGQEFGKQYWGDLQRFLEEERSRFAVYPPPDQVFKAFELTQHAETKVVILG